MSKENLIELEKLSLHYKLDTSFVYSLRDYGLIEIVTYQETACIKREQLREFERILRLHHDLDINLEGIDVILHLLRRHEEMQEELNLLRARLRNLRE